MEMFNSLGHIGSVYLFLILYYLAFMYLKVLKLYQMALSYFRQLIFILTLQKQFPFIDPLFYPDCLIFYLVSFIFGFKVTLEYPLIPALSPEMLVIYFLSFLIKFFISSLFLRIMLLKFQTGSPLPSQNIPQTFKYYIQSYSSIVFYKKLCVSVVTNYLKIFTCISQ